MNWPRVLWYVLARPKDEIRGKGTREQQKVSHPAVKPSTLATIRPEDPDSDVTVACLPIS